jgi:hypothetical protein
MDGWMDGFLFGRKPSSLFLDFQQNEQFRTQLEIQHYKQQLFDCEE